MSSEQQPTPRRHRRAIGLGVAIGFAVGVVAMFLAFLSAGGGHGDYVLARAFFPYSMALTTLTGDRIIPPLVALAAVQFPLYGLLLGWSAAAGRKPLWTTVAVVVVCHTATAAYCFSGALPHFS